MGTTEIFKCPQNMSYIQGVSRKQAVLFPDTVDDYIEEDDPARLMDLFVDRLDLQKMGFVRSEPKAEGRPGYSPRDLLKLYVYGYYYGVRSSRKLERECKVNIQVMWLLGKLQPDFRTISDFRKLNIDPIKAVFSEFNRFCLEMKLFSKSFISIDGSKFKAVNAKDRNFTLNKLDDGIKRLDAHIAEYLSELDAMDKEDSSRVLSREDLEHKLEVAKERKEKCEGYRSQIEESGEKQISLTDPDARLMKQNEGFGVCFNTQVAVDAGSHMIAGFKVTNNATNHGQITELATNVKEDFGCDILETTADKGYEEPDDMADALASGVVPNVILSEGGNTKNVYFPYNEADITDEQRASRKPEDLRTCLEAGVIPDAYKGILTDATIVERTGYEGSTDIAPGEVLKMTMEQMVAKASEGYFIRDPKRNLVVCPMGQILRPKSVKRDGQIRYCNKLACSKCQHKCTDAKFKEADFSKDTLVRIAVKVIKSENAEKISRTKRNKVVYKKARYTLHLDENKMNQRKNLSEHPFGTIKRTMGDYYFLLKTKTKVEAEMALFLLSYNLRRAINMAGVAKMMEALA